MTSDGGRKRRIRGIAATAAIAVVLSALLTGCDEVGRFGDWAVGSVTRAVALTSLANGLRAVDGVVSADYQDVPGSYPVVTVFDVLMADRDPEAWDAVAAAIATGAGDPAITSGTLRVVIHDADSVSVTTDGLGSVEALVARLEDLLSLGEALGVPVQGSSSAGELWVVVAVEPNAAAVVLSDASVRARLDAILARPGVSLSFPGFGVGRGLPGGVVDLYAEAAELGLVQPCGEDGCELLPESVELDWAGSALDIQILSERGFGDPSPAVLALLGAAADLEGIRGGVQYTDSSRTAVTNVGVGWPSVGFALGGCSDLVPLEEDRVEWAEELRTALAEHGLVIPADRFGWC